MTNFIGSKTAITLGAVLFKSSRKQNSKSEKSITFEVEVAEADMGKVIGKQGRLAKSIRTVMKAVAAREHKKVSVEFIG